MIARKVTRAGEGRMLGGVCAGIARTYGWPAWKVRLAVLLTCVLPGPQFIAYIILWIVLPEEPSA